MPFRKVIAVVHSSYEDDEVLGGVVHGELVPVPSLVASEGGEDDAGDAAAQ